MEIKNYADYKKTFGQLSFETYKDKVFGCWQGKNIGGVLGAPYEGKRGVFDIDFYTQEDLYNNPPPNDDLDLQLVWLNAVEKFGRNLDSHILSEYWLHYIIPLWGEYGVSKTNMQNRLLPPLSGSFNNSYGNSNGAFIRSEIWACLAPGHPEIAVKYAYEDAITDHFSEGVYSEVFFAALESIAFVESDKFKLIDLALSYIPKDCDVAKSVNTALEAYKSKKSWQEARKDVLTATPTSFGVQTVPIDKIDYDDVPVGEPGYDAPASAGLVIIGWLYGEDDFGKSICITVNCGEDADCTCATLGAILGIISGGKKIPEKWSEPIGDIITTWCINLTIGGMIIPKNTVELTERFLRLTPKFLGSRHCDILAEDEKYTILTLTPEKLRCPDENLYIEGIGFGNDFDPLIHKLMRTSPNTVRYHFVPFDAELEYVNGPTIKPNEPAKLRLTFKDNMTFHGGNNQWLKIRWYTPDGVTVSPGIESNVLLKVTYNHTQTVEFDVIAENPVNSVDLIADITVCGHTSVCLIKASLIPTV